MDSSTSELHMKHYIYIYTYRFGERKYRSGVKYIYIQIDI